MEVITNKETILTLSAQGPTLNVGRRRLNSIPSLKKYNIYNGRRPIA